MSNKSSGISGLRQNRYSVFSIFCLIYCSASAGAFGVEEIVSGCGPGMCIGVLIGMALIWGFPVVLGTAELSSAMPGEGGYYYWAKHILGEFWGYVMGINGAISFYVCSSTYVVLSVNYLAAIVEMTNFEAIIIKVAIIVIFTIVNLLGLKDVSILSSIFAVLIVLLFAVISVIGSANWQFNPLDPFIPEGMGAMESLSLGIGLGIWMYCGFGVVTLMAGEISNPQIISKAMKLAVPAAALTYLLPTVAGLASVDHWELWSTDGSTGVGFAAVMALAMGDAGKLIFVIIAVISALSIFNTNMAGGSRSFFVLADDNLFPKKGITNVSKRRGVPYIGVISLSVVTLFMMEMEFKALVLIQVIPILVCQVLVSVILVKARKDIPKESRIGCYTVAGGKLGLFLITALPACIAIVAFYLNGMDYFLYGLVFLLLVCISYPPVKIYLGGLHNTHPELFPKNERTRMAYGDLFRIGKLMAIIGILAVLGYFAFQIVEGGWGPEYYAYTYGSGLLSDFGAMRMALLIGGIFCLAIAAVTYIAGNKADKKTAMPTEITVTVGKHDDNIN